MIYIYIYAPLKISYSIQESVVVVMGRAIHANNYPKSIAKHICIVATVVAEYNKINLTIK